jgi:hypothetical protein
VKKLKKDEPKKKKRKKKKKQAEERLKTDAADRMKSAVTRKGTQSEEIEERRAKKRKAETIIQSVKEQEEPTQAVLQSVTTPSKVNF